MNGDGEEMRMEGIDKHSRPYIVKVGVVWLAIESLSQTEDDQRHVKTHTG